MPLAIIDLRIFQGEFIRLPETLLAGFGSISESQRNFLGSIKQQRGITVIAFDGETLVGFARVVHARDMEWSDTSPFPHVLRENTQAYVDVGVGVLPAYQRQGIAQRMVEMLMCRIGPGSLVVFRIQVDRRSKLRHAISLGFDRTWMCTPMGFEMRCADPQEVESYPADAPEESIASLFLMGAYTSGHKHTSSCRSQLPTIEEEST